MCVFLTETVNGTREVAQTAQFILNGLSENYDKMIIVDIETPNSGSHSLLLMLIQILQDFFHVYLRGF